MYFLAPLIVSVVHAPMYLVVPPDHVGRHGRSVKLANSAKTDLAAGLEKYDVYDEE